jgi:glycosyltransferase involved in cell wall biosynthesis
MKDHAGFLEALTIAQGLNPRIVALLCGQGTDVLKIPDRLQGRVKLLGARRDIANVMSACDVGCLSSSFGEAFPNVLSEFMACERPCVTTDVGDAARIVGRYGLVVPPRNPAALAGALVKMAACSAEERRRIGVEGRMSIGERFSIGVVAARHLKLWKQAAVSRE